MSSGPHPLFGYASIALAAALFPALVPPTLPDLRVLVWVGSAAVAAGLGLIFALTTGRTPRRSLLAAG
ncbi:hypothetical protein DMH04_53190 [Kibdelosporangium aridum]|uniref:Uncharacterized protein n=1 Tax=Kibdelosporangium aridum TaxID=2030 RepID=A0A428Y327_KIBAR|nr:hypothetical protein [Kibdelosporangium aridum]RSM61993.1 hypothetical protein DMH04_53190 [Kibdelosporangium aridum]